MNIFKEYTQYIQDNPERLWFKRKLYGWGWTPATKEGWFVTLLYVICVLGFGLMVDESVGQEVLFIFVVPVIVLTIIFFIIAYKKGEKPRWQWGKRKE